MRTGHVAIACAGGLGTGASAGGTGTPGAVGTPGAIGTPGTVGAPGSGDAIGIPQASQHATLVPWSDIVTTSFHPIVDPNGDPAIRWIPRPAADFPRVMDQFANSLPGDVENRDRRSSCWWSAGLATGAGR
jgi:hypothetical protein